MPTGYTEFIENGKITTGADFIMLCARAIDVLGEMFDEPLSAPIPQELKGSSYYKERLDEYYHKLAILRGMFKEDIHNANEEEYQKKLQSRREHIERMKCSLEKYSKVRSEVMAWEPPTNDHVGLKNFAINQINMCTDDLQRNINYYESMPVEKPTDEEWYAHEVDVYEKYVRDYEKKALDAVKRNEYNNRWLSLLRDSLGK